MFRILTIVIVAMLLSPATYIMSLRFVRFAESFKREATLFPSNVVECLWGLGFAMLMSVVLVVLMVLIITLIDLVRRQAS